MHPLDGCRAKILRARIHITALGDAIRGFADRSPYRPRVEEDPATQELVFVAEADPALSPIPLDLILIAGEVAYQLRSALDHLVWQLVLANTGQRPHGTRSAFPIFDTEAGYVSRAPAMIQGVSAQAAARIQAAQPYHAAPAAHRVLTWLVHELNNTDKHRFIPVTATYSCVGQVRMTRSDGSFVDILPWTDVARDRLQPGMEIARVPMMGLLGDCQVDLSLGLDIAFAEVGGVQFEPATSLLVEAADHVGELIESFQGEFSAGPVSGS